MSLQPLHGGTGPPPPNNTGGAPQLGQLWGPGNTGPQAGPEMPPQNFQVPPPPPPGGPPQSLAGGDEGPQTQVVQGFPETRVGRIIGPGGSMIKQIKDDTGAHVSVARERIPGTADVPVTVVGTQAQITKALETMAALIRGNDEKRSDGMAHIVHEHPKEHCKAVIGSRGATITALRDASGVPPACVALSSSSSVCT